MNKPVHTDQPFIRKLTEIILANIGNEFFSVEDLAREAGISRVTIHRRLRLIMKQGASQFIREIRLRRAMELLQQNAGTVSEIAFMVGFGSAAYFNKCFHEFYGFPPGRVKREAQKDIEVITPIEVIETCEVQKPSHRTGVLISIGILSFVVLICLGYFLLEHRSHPVKEGYSPGLLKSIAVLPFRNLTDSVSNQYFIDGIAEEILANLSKIKDLTVLSRSYPEQFMKTGNSLSEKPVFLSTILNSARRPITISMSPFSGMCLWFPINGPGARRFEKYPEFHRINKVMNDGYKEEHDRVKKWLEEHKMI